MALEPIQEATAPSFGTGSSIAELPPAAATEARGGPAVEPAGPEPAPYRYPSLVTRVFQALADPDGYDAGLRRLDDELRRRGPSQFARFYFEELLGRSPDTAEIARELVYFPSRQIRDMQLCSDEFMDEHDIVLQREFAHLSREFFFHIPKSGGTTVFQAFRSDSRFCPVHLYPGFDNGWFAVRLAYLRNTILRLIHPQARYVFLYGHPSTDRILTNNLKRGWDNAFTILRDPIDACLSWVNYVLTQLRNYPNHPDVIDWRFRLELPDDPLLSDRSAVLDLVPKIVELIVPGNPMCRVLGQQPRLESALDAAGILGLKVVRFEQIDAYIRSRGIPTFERMNVSARYVEFSDLDQQIRLMMYDKSAEDIKLHDWITRHAVPGEGPWFEL